MNSVNTWLEKVRATTAAMESIKVDFLELTATMESIRNSGFQNDQKEEIDIVYSDMVAAHKELCGVKAGGRRARTHRKKRASLRRRASLR